MLTYAEAKEMMSRARNDRRKLENNTHLESDAPKDGNYRSDYVVRLHDTDVVTLHPNGSYTLNSGGWRTVTTKDRINRYAPVAVFQRKGQWFVAAHQSTGGWDFDNAVPFEDGMVVSIAGIHSGSKKAGAA